jgi:hypothetical protein
MRDILNSIDSFDLIDFFNFRREPAVKTENLIFYNTGKGQILEHLREHFPDMLISIFSKTLIVESIKLIDFPKYVLEVPVFMITSEDGNSFSMLYLQYEHIKEGLDAIKTSIDIVAHEKVISILP